MFTSKWKSCGKIAIDYNSRFTFGKTDKRSDWKREECVKVRAQLRNIARTKSKLKNKNKKKLFRTLLAKLQQTNWPTKANRKKRERWPSKYFNLQHKAVDILLRCIASGASTISFMDIYYVKRHKKSIDRFRFFYLGSQFNITATPKYHST